MWRLAYHVLTKNNQLKPDLRLPDVSRITQDPAVSDQLKNVKVFLFDKDDTLVPLHSFQVKDPKIALALHQLKSRGKNVLIVSNSVRERGRTLSYVIDGQPSQIEILCTQTKKPYNGEEIKEGMRNRFGPVNGSEVAIVGDRRMTDILLGNFEGWKTILVDSVEKKSIKKHGLGVYLMAKLEQYL